MADAGLGISQHLAAFGEVQRISYALEYNEFVNIHVTACFPDGFLQTL